MDTVFHHHTTQAWLIAFGVAGGTLAVLMLITRFMAARMEKLSTRTDTGIDDMAVVLMKETKFLFVALISLYAGTLVLPDLPKVERTVVEKAAILALFVQIALWGTSAIKLAVDRYRQRALEQDAGGVTTMSAFGMLGRIAVWVVLLLAILQNFGVQVSALLTGLGIGGIAVALAVQNVLGDILSSLSIVLDKPFVIGDFLIVDNMMGTVEHIGLKTTRVRSLSGEQLVFSNSDLLKSRIRNYKRMQERRVVFSFGVLYQTTPDQLERIPQIVKTAIEAEEKVRFDRCHFAKFGESSLDFETVYYVEVPDYNVYMDIQQRLNLAILRGFSSEGIDFAYPTRTLFMQQAA